MLANVGRLMGSCQGGDEYLLDGLGVTAVAAWEMERISSAYTGAHFELRSDGAGDPTDDFSAEPGVTPTNSSGETPAQWLTATSGSTLFVRTVYDQVGSNDLTQTTLADQPEYEATGFNGLPSMSYITANSLWMEANVLAVQDGDDLPCAIFYPIKFDILNNNGSVYSWDDNSASDYMNSYVESSSNIRFDRRGTGDTTKRIDVGVDLTPTLHGVNFSGTLFNVWFDGTQVVTNFDMDNAALNILSFKIGVRIGTQVPLDAQLTGMVIYDQELSVATVNTLNARYMALKGL